MIDSQILALFWDKNEDTIRETDRAYGRKLFVLSDKILHSHQDAEESVSDTYMKTWETIPPQRPVYFFAYLAKLCRNFSLARIQWQSAAKRSAEIVVLFSLACEFKLISIFVALVDFDLPILFGDGVLQFCDLGSKLVNFREGSVLLRNKVKCEEHDNSAGQCSGTDEQVLLL